jgi:hypothetical protein
MNPNNEAPEQQGDDLAPAVPVATTILHMGADIAVAVSFEDGTAAAGGVMPQQLANDLTATVLRHLTEQPDEQTTEQPEAPQLEAEIVPMVATVNVPVAIDLDHFALWYADRHGPSDEPVDVPDPREHPQLAGEYFNSLLNR